MLDMPKRVLLRFSNSAASVFVFENCSIGLRLMSLSTYMPIPAGLSDADIMSAPSAVKALPMPIERAVP